VDAIASGDPQRMADELGDVLLQVAFHAVVAEEAGTFAYDTIEAAIVEKLVRRHPHVFGDAQATDSGAVLQQWAAIKAQERGNRTPSPAERVPQSLPALRRAADLARALNWSDPTPDLTERPLRELAQQPDALAEALVYLASAAARAGVDPELLLRDHLQARLAREGG
jgi:XTP/dITP diphosphohydrolase